ncbi:ABC transporter permease [Vallitalea okinawensis]|uniref:ABC transporter permease n=1 Tax=Vallitalea okinawensis TaxID=2078660 RepID=UPI000CFC2650|nr:ABC transporter permease [Vallitalea okinawensis]
MESRVMIKKSSLVNSSAMQKVLAFGSLILLVVVFSVLSPNFLTKSNIISILLATAVNGVLAVGVTFVIITGGIDLSIGTVMTFASVIAGVFITMWGMPIWIGVLGAIGAGALCGFINGFNVAKFKIPAFIATLGMMMITKGLSLVISGAKPIYFTDTPVFSKISTGMTFGIPNAVYIFFTAAIIAGVVLGKTLLGRYTFAIGSNLEATRLSGVSTQKWLIAIHTLTGAFCGIAGILMAARLNSAQPALGQGYELDAIAAVVIGGTSLSGGKGTILGTIIGAFIMSTLINGLRILSVPQEWQTVVTGIIVIGAVIADVARKQKN